MEDPEKWQDSQSEDEKDKNELAQSEVPNDNIATNPIYNTLYSTVNVNNIVNNLADIDPDPKAKQESDTKDHFSKARLRNFYHYYASDRAECTGKYRFLILCQIMPLAFLVSELFTDSNVLEDFVQPATTQKIVLCRFLCAVILHITLTDEIK